MDKVLDALKAGHAAIFPTDTVYGIGVAVRYASTPQEVFDLKRRESDMPIAWLVGSIEDLDRYGVNVSPEARRMVEEQWPGALTVIVEASSEVPRAFQSRQGTIGLRMPDSETALALIRELGPLAATSANVSGQPAPRKFTEVNSELLDQIAAFNSSDPCSGIASSVIDFTVSPPRVLRP